MFVVTSLNKTKSCSFFFLQFMYSKLKKYISFYIILAPSINNPSSAPGFWDDFFLIHNFTLTSIISYLTTGTS